MVQGDLKSVTSMVVLSSVSEAIRLGAAAASSKPTGPPMSCTTRWKRSRPSSSMAATQNFPSPVQL